MAHHNFNDSAEQILKRFMHASYRDYEIVMSSWQYSQETTRKRFRFRKVPDKYLKKLEDVWTMI